MGEVITIPSEKDEPKLDELKVDEFKEIDKNYLTEKFSRDVHELIQDGNCSRLKHLYDILSEVDDVEKGKVACLNLYNDCFGVMMKIIKENCDNMLKYYVWHFLQLMTCCPEAKQILFADEDAVPLLLQLNMCDWSEDKHLSLKYISLSYILVMMAEASGEYYEYIASTQVIPYLYKILETCVLKPEDTLVELILLCLNLLLEGSSGCKKQLINLDFKSLMSKKIEQRENCHDNMLKVANQTYQKFLLLGCDSKSFVETFRQGFNEDLKKDTLYHPVMCYNISCKASNESTSHISETTFKRCSRCKAVTYCSKDCQIAHWKNSHSKICTAPIVGEKSS